MKRWMLDTNFVSDLIQQRPKTLARVTSRAVGSLCISAITAGEIRFGLAKRPANRVLHDAVAELLLRVDILPWDRETAIVYGDLRSAMSLKGLVLSPMDMLIAAHAVVAGTPLVTRDRAFRQVQGLVVEDWSS